MMATSNGLGLGVCDGRCDKKRQRVSQHQQQKLFAAKEKGTGTAKVIASSAVSAEDTRQTPDRTRCIFARIARLTGAQRRYYRFDSHVLQAGPKSTRSQCDRWLGLKKSEEIIWQIMMPPRAKTTKTPTATSLTILSLESRPPRVAVITSSRIFPVAEKASGPMSMAALSFSQRAKRKAIGVQVLSMPAKSVWIFPGFVQDKTLISRRGERGGSKVAWGAGWRSRSVWGIVLNTEEGNPHLKK